MHWSTPLKQEWLIHYKNPLTRRLSREFFLSLPKAPGVYRFYGRHAGESDVLLYVGKAKNLRDRLSSYRQAKPDSASRKTLWMLGQIRRIEFEICVSERAALLRENELLRTLRPPFNVLNTSPESYVFIVIDTMPRGLRLRLTTDAPPGFTPQSQARFTGKSRPFSQPRYFGAFKSRGAVRDAYGAFLRLLWMCATSEPSERYAVPAALLRYKPPSPYLLTRELPPRWASSPSGDDRISSYFAGRSKRLLGEMAATLLERPSIPAYLYPRIQDDLETLAEFFRLHCARNRRLCRHFGRDGSLIAQDEIDDWSVAYRHADPSENTEKSLL